MGERNKMVTRSVAGKLDGIYDHVKEKLKHLLKDEPVQPGRYDRMMRIETPKGIVIKVYVEYASDTSLPELLWLKFEAQYGSSIFLRKVRLVVFGKKDIEEQYERNEEEIVSIIREIEKHVLEAMYDDGIIPVKAVLLTIDMFLAPVKEEFYDRLQSQARQLTFEAEKMEHGDQAIDGYMPNLFGVIQAAGSTLDNLAGQMARLIHIRDAITGKERYKKGDTDEDTDDSGK